MAVIPAATMMISDPHPAPLVVSGFEAYTTRPVNASSVVARAMAAGAADTAFVEVPVVWGAPMKVVAAWPQAPEVWLALGESSSSIRVESVAYNRRAAHPDKRGELPGQMEILPGAAAVLVNPASAGELAGRLTAEGFPAGLSHNAGGYLCEELFYVLLHHQANVWQRPALVHFVHLPLWGSPVPGDPGGTVDRPYLEALAGVLRRAIAEARAGWWRA